MVYTRMAEYAFERDAFLLLAPGEAEAPALHHRFLDRRSPLPLHRDWAEWLWRRGLAKGEIAPLQAAGDRTPGAATPTPRALREDLSVAVGSGLLTLPPEGAQPIHTNGTEGDTR